MANLKLTTHSDLLSPARVVVQRCGLDNTSEYIRIALEYLIEHGRLPPEFEGRRSRMTRGRPVRRQ